ncbi:MAG: hypothetical protein AAF487_06405 [Bacteroidota bacterium]
MKDVFHYFLMVFSAAILLVSCYNEDNLIEATCTDGILNQDEVFVDCGGPNCDPCVPTCDNGIQDVDVANNWIEEGIDCGGPCESCCGNGVVDAFEEWVDCGGPECEPCEQCANGVMDGAETGIDCDDNPDTDCPPCSELCNDGLLNGNEECADCGGACVPCDNSYCFNGELDDNFDIAILNETGIDCGGCQCPPCIELCNDGILNGNEVEIDCGGDDCPPCADQCSDGIQNGLETGVDCDDDPSTPCPSCPTLCANNVFDGTETNQDCGGPDCPPCFIDCYMTYDVTYNAGTGLEITDSYESYESEPVNMAGLKETFDVTAPELIPPNTAPALFNLVGGLNPLLAWTDIQAPNDQEESDPGSSELDFTPGSYTINNVNAVAGDNAVVTFVAPNDPATVYVSNTTPVGIILQIQTWEYQEIPGFDPTFTIEATFEGQLYDQANDKTINVTNGVIYLIAD